MINIDWSIVTLNRVEQHRFAVIDDVLTPDDLAVLKREILDSRDSDEGWFHYNTPIEIKSSNSQWLSFPPIVYECLTELCSPEMSLRVSSLFDEMVTADVGLHGAGIHLSGASGNLNPHLDYEVHPKLNRRRLVNAILYLNDSGRDFNGGELGLWSIGKSIHEDVGEPITTIIPKAGRLVFFDVSGEAWHGFVNPVDGGERLSLAAYYLSKRVEDNEHVCSPRRSAVFAQNRHTIQSDGSNEAIIARATRAGFKSEQ
jgi:hypothetical protein